MSWIKTEFGYLFDKAESKKFMIQFFKFGLLTLLLQFVAAFIASFFVGRSDFFKVLSNELMTNSVLIGAIGAVSEVGTPIYGCSYSNMGGYKTAKCDLTVYGTKDRAKITAKLVNSSAGWVIEKAYAIRPSYDVVLIKQ